METLVHAKSRNRKSLVVFVVAVLIAVLLVEALVYFQHRQQLAKQNRDELGTEIILLGELAKDALLRSDYTLVEDLVTRWMDRHDYLIRISAVMPNGFVLTDISRARPTAESVETEHEVVFGGRRLVTLRASADFSAHEYVLSSILLKGVVGIGAVVLLMGLILWSLLQRIAIRPLEREVLRRVEKEQDLRQRTSELETAINELESFSYSVSHDLRAPLRAIDGYHYALAEDYGPVLDETAMGYIHRSRAAAQRMSVVIDGLLGLTRVSRHKMSMGDVDLSRLVTEELARLAEAEPDRRVETCVSPGLRVRGDETLLDIALDNLVRNAWKYTARQAQPRIEFGSEQKDGETVYFVKDNGAGFDMQYAGKLFGAFERLHTPEEFPGTGIGLAISARVIRQHGGRIWAEAEPGKGASFYFTLARTS